MTTFIDWQATTPRTAGFYWVQCKGQISGKFYLHIAKVYASNPKPGSPVDTVFIDGDNYPLTSPGNIEQWGYEPIPEPVKDPS